MALPATPAPHAWTREAAGGAVAGMVAVAYALSYAALLFAGPLHALLPLGLGLCLVREVAQLHGGTISLHNNPVSGTTATLLLPKKTN